MNFPLVLVGGLAWSGVIVLAILMAEWDEPVWGWFPIVAAVLGAWGVGELITERIWRGGNR